MATLQNIGKLKYRGKDGQWHDLPVVVQDADGSVSTISGKGAPTSATQGKVNQLYRDEDTQKLYICTAVDGGYTWAAVSGGSVDVDATLTKSGQAADAKAAGDAIEKKIDAPQAAQVGEVLAVEEVDAEGKPKKWKTQAVETDPPDWNASLDEPGYIKNRTHYKIPMTGAGSPGYKVNFLDGNHSVGDIVLLQAATSNLVKSFLIAGINNPKDKNKELCVLTKIVHQNGYVSNLETVCEDKENIMEITTLSEGNVKALYSVSRKQCLAWYFISDLSTLDEEHKTKFTQVGAYAQWVDDYPKDDIAELWVSYQLYSYVKLHGRYLDSSVERTANKVDSIDKSSTAEQYPSAKSVYETINKKCADVMPQKTTKECGEGETVTLADNAEYRLTNVTALTFAYPEDDFECWIRLTIAESGDVAVTFPEDTKYIGSAPTFANDEMWELSIKDGVVIAQKVGDGT
nr:MAG TPA: hypothetical protein [Caudoviricetes sp.]